jgi:glucokinase
MSRTDAFIHYGLVADIGGTNARFALVASGSSSSSRPEIMRQQVLRCDDYPSLEEAIRVYYKAVAVPAESVIAATIAVAGPVHNDIFEMTNNHWRFSQSAVRKALRYEHFALINDFTALAWSVPCLLESEYVTVGGGAAQPGGVVGIVGPGTGLGVGGFVRGEKEFIALETEGGHAGFAPCDEIETKILGILQREFGRVSNERLLSGPGLINIYRALAMIRQEPLRDMTAADITDAAVRRSDLLCTETLNRFCSILGNVAGDLALVLGARGGVYIAGGIVPKFIEFLRAGDFRERFEAKGRFQGYNAGIATRVITADYPGLLGAAAHLLNKQRATG